MNFSPLKKIRSPNHLHIAGIITSEWLAGLKLPAKARLLMVRLGTLVTVQEKKKRKKCKENAGKEGRVQDTGVKYS